MDEILEQSLLEAVTEMRDLLKRDDFKAKVHAARTLCWINATHKRTTFMEARTQAYTNRCNILNQRTTSATPHSPQNAPRPSPSASASDSPNTASPPSSANSASSAVKRSASPGITPPNWRDFYRDLPPGSINPWNGEVVPEEHISQIPDHFTDKEAISFIVLPGPKTKADYQRAVTALLNHNEQMHQEHNALKAEINVFRSERLGSITTEKREELLAGRYESNKRTRENKPTPFFIKDLTAEELAAHNKREPHPPEVIDVGLPRTHDFDNDPTPTSPPHRDPSLPSPKGEMSRGSASDRQGASRVRSSNSPTDTPTSASASVFVSLTNNSPSLSSPSPCPSVPSVVKSPLPSSAVNNDLPPGYTRDAEGNILSPRAAARRADPNRYIFKPRQLTHPTPLTRRGSNSS